MTQYNIYFGTIGKTLGCKYRFTKWCKDEESAKNLAREYATNFYYKNIGKHGIPSLGTVVKESKLSGVDIETLNKEHIEDIMRYYAIPTIWDTISNKDIIL